VALIVWMIGSHGPAWRVVLPRMIIPLCVVALLCGMFIGYYNWRNTGNPFLFPYALNERTYFSTPVFIWQNAATPRHYRNPQFEEYYNGWDRNYWSYYRVTSFKTALRHLGLVVPRFVNFFMWPELCIPLLAVPWVLSDHRVRFLVIQAGFCFLGCFSVIWFLPHYAAPVTATAFTLLTQAIRHLRYWQHRGRPVGVGLTRMVVLFALVLAPFHQRDGTLDPPLRDLDHRATLTSTLNSLPGEHLVIVRYSPSGGSGEWVYNAADVDHAKIVWAREIPGVSMKPLMDYFKSRKVWLVEPAVNPITLQPYSLPTVIANRKP
jgi:hypothetical protein